MIRKRGFAAILAATALLNINVYAASPETERLQTINARQIQAEGDLSRADFFAVVSRLFQKEALISISGAGAGVLPFADAGDIPPGNKIYFEAMYKAGFISGSAEGGALYARPLDSVSRQDLMTILGRVSRNKADTGLSAFPDAGTVSEYAKPYVSWFAGKGLLGGEIRPRDAATLDEAAPLILAAYDFAGESERVSYGRVSAVAGTGSAGSFDASSSKTRFFMPYSLTFDKNGDMFIFDTYNNLIRRIQSGRVGVVTGQVTALGDNSAPKGRHLDDTAEKSLLNRPVSGVFTKTGALVFADSGNSVLRVLSGGKVRTYAGSPRAAFADGDKKSAAFNTPCAIAIDSADNIYVADTLNNRIRKVDPNGNVTTFAGTGEAAFSDGRADLAAFSAPMGIAVSESGAGTVVYVADTGNNRIRRIADGKVTTLAGAAQAGFIDGEAKQARFNFPAGLTTFGDSLIIVDSGNHSVRKLQDGRVETIAGNGEPGDELGESYEAMLHMPMGAAVKGGEIYIADTGNNKIKKIKLK
ncbi:MAG: hypothetical protein LBU36_02270 [Clostridiales bacterium]|jgi:sugar lactone lactonase YvrE|nr:hypothetical protein [Clostridiales bacterium]